MADTLLAAVVERWNAALPAAPAFPPLVSDEVWEGQPLPVAVLTHGGERPGPGAGYAAGVGQPTELEGEFGVTLIVPNSKVLASALAHRVRLAFPADALAITGTGQPVLFLKEFRVVQAEQRDPSGKAVFLASLSWRALFQG